MYNPNVNKSTLLKPVQQETCIIYGAFRDYETEIWTIGEMVENFSIQCSPLYLHKSNWQNLSGPIYTYRIS